MASGGGEAEGRGVRVHLGMQLEEGFVNASQLFGTQVLVVDGAPHVAVHGEGERPDGVQQVGVRQLAGVEVGNGLVAPEERPKGREGKLGAAGTRAKLAEDQRKAVPQVGMGRPAAALGQGAQAIHGIVAGVPIACPLQDGRKGVGSRG